MQSSQHQTDGQPLYLLINKPAKVDNQRLKIAQWFYIVLLKGVFGGQADTILTSMREVRKSRMSAPEFPVGAFVERY